VSLTPALDTTMQQYTLTHDGRVRLTPTECERLQTKAPEG